MPDLALVREAPYSAEGVIDDHRRQADHEGDSRCGWKRESVRQPLALEEWLVVAQGFDRASEPTADYLALIVKVGGNS